MGYLPTVVENVPPTVPTADVYGPPGSVSMVYAGTEVAAGLSGRVDNPWIAISSVTGDYRALDLPDLPDPSAGAISVSPDVPASGKRLRELRRKITELDAVCVFAEPQIDTRLVDNLIEGTSARPGTLDPEGVTIEAGPELYFTLMRRLADDLKRCLSPPA